jgi:hypothetical protein
MCTTGFRTVVEHALKTAVEAVIPPALQEIANRLQYRGVDSLRKRFPALCEEIMSRRKTAPRMSRALPGTVPVPGERIEPRCSKHLDKDGPTDLQAVAASVGLGSKRRLHDLRSAIVEKNAELEGNASKQLRRR